MLELINEKASKQPGSIKQTSSETLNKGRNEGGKPGSVKRGEAGVLVEQGCGDTRLQEMEPGAQWRITKEDMM